ncbi:MAG: DUF72 domain-containing protein [Phormidesmis priestleyi]|uniref:DUF72 domain-containing protein n=1 Tax=Phormidesmis priestleyi TaxID=268141 RepID=A0A2W4WSQ6_9CYAN|nr:MAG: DUF72 domain-containing protein [Phormidesmis priestleyi]
MNFLMGCAVWAFKDWVGSFYPPKSQPTNFLRLYGERMLTVEGNTTFYSVPSAAMVQRWADQTPDDFRFCPKLPRTITHAGPLMAHLPAALSFLELMQGLGSRLGPVMAQLPPSYSPVAIADLTNFLTAWPRQVAPISVEVRHLDWFQAEPAAQLTALLTQLGVGRVLLDTRPIYAWEAEGDTDPQLRSHRRKPKVPLQPVVTADFAIVRYISHPRLLRNHDYLAAWVTQVNDWLSLGKQVYFFVHCPMEVESPAIARYFQTCLESAQAPVPPLPWMALAQPPDQLALF